MGLFGPKGGAQGSPPKGLYKQREGAPKNPNPWYYSRAWTVPMNSRGGGGENLAGRERDRWGLMGEPHLRGWIDDMTSLPSAKLNTRQISWFSFFLLLFFITCSYKFMSINSTISCQIHSKIYIFDLFSRIIPLFYAVVAQIQFISIKIYNLH